MVVPGGWAFSYERGTPVHPQPSTDEFRVTLSLAPTIAPPRGATFPPFWQPSPVPGVEVLGFGIWDFGGLGSGVWCVGFGVGGLGSGVWGLGFGVWG